MINPEYAAIVEELVKLEDETIEKTAALKQKVHDLDRKHPYCRSCGKNTADKATPKGEGCEHEWNYGITITVCKKCYAEKDYSPTPTNESAESLEAKIAELRIGFNTMFDTGKKVYFYSLDHQTKRELMAIIETHYADKMKAEYMRGRRDENAIWQREAKNANS